MKFAHISDCHIGGWKQEKLKKISIESFEKATEICIEKNVDFIILAGDLFDTALPSIPALKKTTKALKKIKDNNIPVYLIAGSHDFSPSGKTMLDVLENAGLCINVCKIKDNNLEFTKHNNIKITGMVGLMGGLEKLEYENLKNKEQLENESGFKIFLFHSLLTELKPTKGWDNVPSEALSLLPKNFNYYAGGHPHFVIQKSFPNHPMVTYPGPLTPNNFKELEELKQGGFYIVEKKEDNSISLEHLPIKIKETKSFIFDGNNKSAINLEKEIKETLEQEDLKDKIITIRASGTLLSGKPSDINFKEILQNLDCYIPLKNTNKLVSKEFEEIAVEAGDIEDIEEKIMKEHIGQITLPNITDLKEEDMVNQLMILFDKEKNEGEKNADFESRIINDIEELLIIK